ncbi:MAG: hypothetical protein IPM95_02890 [Sphingobacteriales bacterium]|nr:hypothetical protein [Sphingobacteriales bacterium]
MKMLFLDVAWNHPTFIYLIAFLLALAVNVFSWHLPFFWDTLLTSTITQHFYEDGLQSFIAPPRWDVGHPPLFYLYLTAFYHLFGKSLFSAHAALLPFTITGFFSFLLLLKYFSISGKQQWIGLLLFIGIPAVITQNLLVSYDAVLLSLYLLALVSILKDKKFLLVLSAIIIAGVSIRGLFCLAALSITIYFWMKRDLKKWIQWNLLFIPAVLLAASWYYYHFLMTGWVFATNSQEWSAQRGIVGLGGMVKNVFSIGRAMFDYGAVILSVLGLFYLFSIRKLDILVLLWLIPLVIFSLLVLPFSNPINHRYFLVVYVLMLPSVILVLSERRIIFTIFTFFLLLLGNFQIYPSSISNGWDCTLAHVPYHTGMSRFIEYCNINKFVDKKGIGTVFPMNVSTYQYKMDDNRDRLINVNGHSLDTVAFVLYSNVGNDFSEEQLIQLKHWKSVWMHKKGLVELNLLKNPQK